MAGRPSGSVETAEGILRQEMIQWAKTHKRIRGMIERELEYFEGQQTNQAPLMDAHLQIMQGLREVLITTAKVMESGMRIIREVDGGGKPPSDDPEEVMRELMEGDRL